MAGPLLQLPLAIRLLYRHDRFGWALLFFWIALLAVIVTVLRWWNKQRSQIETPTLTTITFSDGGLHIARGTTPQAVVRIVPFAKIRLV